MKANFSLTKRYVPKFKDNDKLDGANQLVAVLKMPEVQDVFTILDRLSNMGFKAGESDKVDTTQAASIAKESEAYVIKYVTLENAEDFTIADVVKYSPFFPLATELLFALVEFAQPSEDDTKNS